ncbi:MAG: hypothetical protein CM15mP129_01500 [Chloroflexota bacterium]|nr:MAG: hypothetical protein CM15mP129_01500 [Chloroflexota bacterium]
MKFVSNKILIDTNVEFNNIDEASEMKFARELFKFPFVKSIYIDRNYISITKYEISDWGEITPQLRSFIIDFLSKNKLEYKKSKPQKFLKVMKFQNKLYQFWMNISSLLSHLMGKYCI